MPAEWEPQAATWTSWPHNLETWPENLELAQAEFVQLVLAIASSQKVYVLVAAEHRDAALQRFAGNAMVELVPIQTNDAWARDYAPTFVHDFESGELVVVDWYYNAWGGKYPPFDSDQQAAWRVADYLGLRHLAGGLCCEGGAIEINEAGVLLTTESCLLNPNRNAGYGRNEIERILRQRLGCNQIVWLPGDLGASKALDGDDTDGHVDQLARFVSNDTIVHAWCEESDRRYPSLAANAQSIRQQLPEVNLVPLKLPLPFEYCSREIPASYCNFVITNKQLIVPQFGVAEDQDALTVLSSLAFQREVVSLPSRDLAVGLGSFHCLTQHQPVSNSSTNSGTTWVAGP